MRKVGIRYYNTNLGEESFTAIKDGGIDAVELSCVRELDTTDFKAIRQRADRFGIHIWSAHLPFRGEYSIVQDTDEQRKKAVELNSELIKKVSDIGVDKFVIHPSFILHDDADRNECIKQSQASLDELCEIADRCGARLAVENMITRCLGRTADELLEIISINEKLRICFDVNHLLHDNHEDFAEKVRHKLITMHISDYDFIEERHWFPGEGKIDWVALYKKICEIGYTGTWMYELSPGGMNDLRSRPLTVRDFRNNANEIFSGKVPSRI